MFSFLNLTINTFISGVAYIMLLIYSLEFNENNVLAALFLMQAL